MMVRCFYSLSISAYHSYGEKFARDGQNIEEDQIFSGKNSIDQGLVETIRKQLGNS